MKNLTGMVGILFLFTIGFPKAAELSVKDPERIVSEGEIITVAEHLRKPSELFGFLIRHDGVFYTCVDLMAITCTIYKQKSIPST